MKSIKLIWHIFPANLLITISAMLAVTWYGSTSLQTFFLQHMQEDLVARAYLVEKRVAEFLGADQRDSLETFCRQTGRKSATRITVILPSGVVIADSDEDQLKMDNHGNRPEIITALAGNHGSSIRYSATLGERRLYVALPLTASQPDLENDSAEPILGALRMSVSIAAIEKTLRHLQTSIAFGALIVALIAALITMAVSRKISRPLEKMKESAERFAKGQFDPPLTTSGRVAMEVGALGGAMNRMAEQLQERIDTIIQQRNELETVFSSMLEAVLVVDTRKRIINVNKAGAGLLGINRIEAPGKSIKELVRSMDLQRLVSNVLASEDVVEDEIIIADGSKNRYLQTNGVKMYDGNSVCLGTLLVMNDVTRLRRLENVRRDFVANVSHELKTPVTSIKGYAETILDSTLEDVEQTRGFLKIIVKQSDRLVAIINDLLDLSRIEQESRKEKIQLAPGFIKNVLDEVVEVCLLRAEEKNITIDMDCSNDLQAPINEAFLEQAVANLLINAIKYSDTNSRVELRGERQQQSGREMIAISVRDYGAGIGKKHLPRLFERFYRSDKARSRKLGGTGLGLAIVKHIAQAHNGSITVESEPGKGSIFTVYLPANNKSND